MMLIRAAAQPADDVTGVSVAIKLYGLTWNSDPAAHLAVSIDALNGHPSTEADYTDSETEQILARLALGKSYTLSLTQTGLTAATILAAPPPGYTMEIEGVAREQHTVLSPVAVRLRLRPPADAAPGRAGLATSLGTERTLWQAALGSLSTGDSAGALGFIDAAGPGAVASIFRPEGLVYDAPSSEVLVLVNPSSAPAPYVPGTLRQIIAPQVAVNVHMDSAYQCQIQFYHRAQLGAVGSDGIYTFSGDPFAWYFFGPYGTNGVKILCGLRNTTGFDSTGRPVVLPPLQPVVRSKVTLLERTGNTPDFTWTATDWITREWFESGQAPLSQDVRARSGATETLTTLPGSPAAAYAQRTYGALPWGSDVTREVIGTTDPISTDFEYWTTLSPQSAGYSRLRSQVRTGGHWEAYEYYDYADGIALAGGLKRRHRPFNNSDTSVPSLAAHGGEITHYTWANDAFGRATRPALVETTVNGVTTAKSVTTYASASPGSFPGHTSLQLVVATRTDFSAAAAGLTTVTKYFRENSGVAGAPGDDFFRSQTHSVQRPDGVKQVFAYQRGTWTGTSFTLSGNSGLDAPTGVFASRVSMITGSAAEGTLYAVHEGYDIEDVGLIDGKSTLQVTLRDNYARVVRTESYVRSGGAWHLIGAANLEWNFSNQLIRRATNDSPTFDLAAGAIYEASYEGELLTSSTDESGIVVSHTYDPADRVDVTTKDSGGAIGALSTKFHYDAARRMTEQRVGYGQTEQIVTSRSYDDAGRLRTEAAPGPNGAITTTYAYNPGLRETTIAAPLGRTRTQRIQADGSMQQLTGSAVVPEYYTYQVQAAGVRYARIDVGISGSTRTREAWADWLGRATTKSRPGFTGQSAFVEQHTFEAGTGRLRKSASVNAAGSRLLADTLYEYDGLSQVTQTGLDVDHNDALNTASSDRITSSNQFYESVGGSWWHTKVAKTYPIAGNGTPLVVATTRERLTGFIGNLRAETIQIDVNGNTTTRTVTVDRAAKTTTVTTQTSGVVNAQIETAINGLPSTVRRSDGLVYAVGHDALHRQNSSTDPRTGTTTTIFRTGSAFVWWVRDAASHPTVIYAYDAAGRVITMTDAAGRIARTEYNARDQVVRRWGDGAHPVEFGHNALGERETMKTFRGGSGWTGSSWPISPGTADWTRWEYDAPSGLLRAKYDALNLNATGAPIANPKCVSYTYNARGQPAARTWARGVSVTYGYDSNTGELLSQMYSDGTPPVTYTYTRAGQLSTAGDVTGVRTFSYGSATASNAMQLDWLTLPTFYGNRRVTRLYDTIKRPAGFQVGTAAAPTVAEFQQAHTYSPIGRFEQLASAAAGQISRTFTYSYFKFMASDAEPRATLVAGYSSGSFAVARNFEPNRDLLTVIEATWGGAARTRYDYDYNAAGQRITAKQSGNVFSAPDDLGGSTYYRYVYGPRGELSEAVNYRGEDPTSTASPQLIGRRFGYSHDNIGNRLSATRTLGTDLSDAFTANALNQYSSRENDLAYVAGTANTASTIAVSGALAVAAIERADRYWGAEISLGNSAGPATANLSIKATLAGTPTLERTETRTACVPPALQLFVYDADGNLVRDDMWVYVWDAENRLTDIFTCGAPEDSLAANPASVATWNSGVPRRKLEFKYDYLGRRVQKRAWQWSGTAWTVTSERRFLYEGWDVVAEFDAPGGISCGTTTRSYTWGLDVTGSLTAAGGVGALVQITDHGSGASYLPTYDGNGNVASLLRASDGQVAAKYEYSPFGELLRCEGTYAHENPFRFSTKFTDVETSLVYYGFRYYAPSLGRFINRDPMEESGGLNLYGFCGNDGVNRWDFLGQKSFFSKLWKKFRHTVISAALYAIPGAGPILSMMYNAAVGARYGGIKGMVSAIAGSGYLGGYMQAAAHAYGLYKQFGNGKFLTNVGNFLANRVVWNTAYHAGNILYGHGAQPIQQKQAEPEEMVDTSSLTQIDPAAKGNESTRFIHASFDSDAAKWRYFQSDKILTRHVFVNGIVGTLLDHIGLMSAHLNAEVKGLRQYTLMNNRSHGGFSDILETGLDILGMSSHPARLLAGGLKDAIGRGITPVVIGHSQGGAILTQALRILQMSGVEANGMQVVYHAAASNSIYASSVARSIGAHFGGHAYSSYDAVPNLVGMSANALQIIPALLGAPDLFAERNASPHSVPNGAPNYAWSFWYPGSP